MAARFLKKSTSIVVIVWYEPKETSSSPTCHYFEARPINLQNHPKNASQVIRVCFGDKMLSWMNRYFECKRIFQDGMVGCWIANRHRFEMGKPLNVPNIKGCINAFINLIPTVVEDYHERVWAGMETIAANLAIDPSFYEPFGLHYRPAEITDEGKSDSG